MRVKMEMGSLNQAVENALEPTNSDRLDLLTIYKNSWKDSQVITEREKANAFLITEPFEVCKTGSEKVDKKRTELFARPWFTHFLTLAMNVEFWGYTLAEFQEQDEKGEFSDVKVFPRLHVRPFEKEIVINPVDREGISYDGHETEFFLIPLGDPEDLGKLESISREIIWKTFARSDWSEYNERYGKPFITYETETENEAELDEAIEMATKFGSDLVGVINSSEKLTVTAVASRESSDNYKSLAEFCDSQIAKIMNGQTGTSENGAWTGTSEVHERVLTEFTKARLKRIQDIINYTLFPFLVAHGYNLKGYRFRFYGLKSKKENTVDNKSYDKPEPAKENDPEKEGDQEREDVLGFYPLITDYEIGFPRLMNELYTPRCLMCKNEAGPALKIELKDKMRERILQRIHRGFNVKDEIDPDLFSFTLESLNEAVETGVNDPQLGDPDPSFLKELKYNNAVFAAFKTHREQNDLAALLIDEEGRPRSFDSFRKASEGVIESYNVTWLKTEHETAIKSARTASRFKHFEKDRDLFPNLKWLASRAVNPREAHKSYYNTVRSMTDGWWKTHYPGCVYGCQCDFKNTDEAITHKGDFAVSTTWEPAASPGLDQNPAMTGRIFSNAHPYFVECYPGAKKAVEKFIKKAVRK